ncbi:OmpH family outer membrane protein [Pseudooctadecabacter jejudonensis]|uniref:Outer membrane protein (OmpH-like) n=1 Tax=Pseudooctadecabacter jejudonensis TaxID=1391910 RepID=A0A1Y5RGF8_9RHOB|nr:OmpH family outer membrane protein [Pseudooctadecabacter jejudonensis]SLN16871.1 Outer membrane protein (OmpH-like) [Pseudooctadecabacter jejudonensis]
MRLRRVAVTTCACVAALGAVAQDEGAAPVLVQGQVQVQGGAPVVSSAQSSLLVIDFDRLFGQSLFGQRVIDDYRSAGEALAAEQRRLAEALREEELDLAAQRSTMAPDVFRQEAEAFDEKARAIRRAQDAKVDALEASLGEARTQFLEASRPILEQLLIENSATVLVERRSALLWLPSVDITDAAIARINETLGDGADLPDTGQ